MIRYLFSLLGAALIGAVAMLPTSGAASSLTFYNDASVPTGERFTLSCTLTCQGALWDGSGTFSSTVGDLTTFSNSGIATETSAVNAELGTSFVSGTQTSFPDLVSYVFSSSANYFLLKIGLTPNFALVWNTGGAGNVFSFLQTGQGAGLSHITEFGLPQVPLPATGLLLLGALAGLGAVKRRRKSA